MKLTSIVYGLVLMAFLTIAYPAVAHGNANPQILISTSAGDITLELDQARAPVTVAHFLRFIEKDGFKQTIFHRVIKGFMVQGGAHLADLSMLEEGNSLYNEARNGLRNMAGTIAMARSNDIDSAARQFFINTADNYFLDHQRGSCTRDDEAKQKLAASRGLYKPATCKSYGYTAFGRVIEGMDVVRKIEAVAVSNRDGFENLPVNPVTVFSIEVL